MVGVVDDGGKSQIGLGGDDQGHFLALDKTGMLFRGGLMFMFDYFHYIAGSMD